MQKIQKNQRKKRKTQLLIPIKLKKAMKKYLLYFLAALQFLLNMVVMEDMAVMEDTEAMAAEWVPWEEWEE